MAVQYRKLISQYNEAISHQHRTKIALAITSLIVAIKKTRINRKKRIWVSRMLQLRPMHGFYNAIMPELVLDDRRYENYLRMSASQFEELLLLVGPLIKKKDVVRKSIPAAERLSLTLRYLASGDCLTSMMYHYLIAQPTISKIIKETCNAIWDILQPLVLAPCTESTWKIVAKDFENLWNFPHCCGAIDGRHIEIDCPPNAGSQYYNYKGYHSIVLLAVCDAKYMFTCVDIGACGRRGDAAVFRTGVIGQNLENKMMNLPAPEPLYEEGPTLPYFFVGDEAFPLTTYMLRPYPGKLGLSREQQIFNYRLSRARRMIENTFGIVVSQWRVLRKPIECKVELARDIVKAIVCLHNWLGGDNLRRQEYIDESILDHEDITGNMKLGSWRSLVNESALRIQSREMGKTNLNSSRLAKYVRDEFCRYFDEEGEVSWQAVAVANELNDN